VGSSPPAGLAGHLFDNAHKTIAPARQPRPYIRSRELRSVVESAHSKIARKTEGRIKHKMRHMALTGDGQSLFRRARSPNVCAKTFLARPFQGQLGVSNTSAEMRGSFSPHVGRIHQTPKVSPAVAAGVTSAFENLVILLTCWKLGNKSAWATWHECEISILP